MFAFSKALKAKSQALFIVSCVLITASCNSWAQTPSRPADTAKVPTVELPKLDEFIKTLTFTPLVGSNGLRSKVAPSQFQQFTLTASTTILNKITWTFYTDCCCTSAVNIVALTGTTILPNGTYTMSNASSNFMCNAYPGGCTTQRTAINSIGLVYNNGGDHSGQCYTDSRLQSAPEVDCTSTSCGFPLDTWTPDTPY